MYDNNEELDKTIRKRNEVNDMFELKMLIAIILIATEILFVLLTVQFFKKRRDFNERGKHTMATVIDKRGGRKRPAYTLEYMVDDKLQSAKYTTDSFQSKKEGEMVEIAYLPEDPKQVMFAEEITNTSSGIVYIIMCVALLFFIFKVIAV
jgi:hypothetical protein